MLRSSGILALWLFIGALVMVFTAAYNDYDHRRFATKSRAWPWWQRVLFLVAILPALLAFTIGRHWFAGSKPKSR